MSAVFLSLLLFFGVNSAGCSGAFHVVFKHFENLENLILKNLEGKIAYSWTSGLFFSENRVKLFE